MSNRVCGRIVRCAALACALLAWADREVRAEPTYSENIVPYAVTGKTVAELLQSIERNGPRSAEYTGHAVARTRPKFSWHWDLAATPAGCRIASVKVALEVTIQMPRWQDREQASASLRAEWDRYIADVLAHERRHAAIARRTAQAIEARILSLTSKPTCAELRSTVRPAVEAIVRTHDAEQAAFDAREGSCRLRKSCLNERVAR